MPYLRLLERGGKQQHSTTIGALRWLRRSALQPDDLAYMRKDLTFPSLATAIFELYGNPASILMRGLDCLLSETGLSEHAKNS